MSGSLLLGVDIGTSSSKGVLCTPDGEVLASAVVAHDTSFPRPGWAEHDADAIWWTELVAICHKLTSGPFSAADIGGVAVSAIGPCLLPLDASGAPLRPAILYGIDTRATAEIELLNDQCGQQAILDLSGVALTSQTVGPKILWLRRNEPDLFARTAMVHSASDYLVYKLTGEHVMDFHTATYLAPLFDRQRMAWDDRFADAVIELDRLPRLGYASEIAGHITPRASAETGLPVGTPVTFGTIDVAAESLSVGITDPGDTMVMYGSTMFLLSLVEAPVPDPRMWTLPYSLPEPRVVAGGMATSGLITQWFRNVAARDLQQIEREGGENAFSQLAAEALSIPAGAEGLICLPYFAGERTPLHDADARGMFAGLTLRHTRAHLYRAILEGVGYGARHNLDVMAEMGAAPIRCVAVGGGAQNDLWLQIVSDITGITQHIPERTMGASYGDAFLSGLATGLVSGPEVLNDSWVRIDRQITPNPAYTALYDHQYEIYRSLYETTKDAIHRLARGPA